MPSKIGTRRPTSPKALLSAALAFIRDAANGFEPHPALAGRETRRAKIRVQI